MNFWSYLLRRAVGILFVLIGVSIVTFVISHIVPGDPAAAALGDRARDEQIEAFRTEYGLDRPVVEQYIRYVSGLVRGDMGRSIRTRRPVTQDLGEKLPATIELAIAALLIAIVLGIPAGIWSAIHRNQLPDILVRIFSLVGGSLPIFWLGLLMIGLFYNQLGWLPAGGRIGQFTPPPDRITGMYTVDSFLTGNLTALQSSLHHLILPAFVLGYFSTAVIARMMRSSMLEVLNQDYLRTARAKGLKERAVILRHGFRNALIPTLTIIGITFGSLLSGAVLTETIFSWPGLGGYATSAAIGLDFPAVMGVTLIAGIIFPLSNLFVDLGYAWLDPRIRHG
ncbi:MAG: ABC transporter permease [Anaerolineae bacterium]|nr:ABC transporter permease [Anaerolineae bacterium]